MTQNNATEELSPRPRQLKSLTGIRGIAAIWVILFHIGQGIPNWSISPWLHASGLVRNGFRGVDLFFALSGFIMMHGHERDFTSLRLATIGRFALERIVRIYPPAFAALVMILLATLAFPGYVAWFRSWASLIPVKSYTWPSFLQTATLSNRWLVPDLGIWNVVTWSLSVELLAYTILPPLAFTLTRINNARFCLVIALSSLISMVVLLIMFHDKTGNSVTRLGIIRGFGGFIAGASVRRYVSLTSWHNSMPGLIAMTSVSGIMALLFFPPFCILMPFFFATLIVALSFERGLVNAVLITPPAMFVGQISYSLYLVHYTPLAFLEWLFVSRQVSYNPTSLVIGLIMYFVVVLVLTVSLHYGVERPSRIAGRRLVASYDRLVVRFAQSVSSYKAQ